MKTLLVVTMGIEVLLASSGQKFRDAVKCLTMHGTATLPAPDHHKELSGSKFSYSC